MMATYTYRRLDAERQEMRFVDLLPGHSDQNLSLRIFHAPLVKAAHKSVDRISQEELQSTLPAGWHAKQTIEGRYLFMWLGGPGSQSNSWIHPDPDFQDHDRYQRLESVPKCSEIEFEALSYTWGSSVDGEEAEVLESDESDGFDFSLKIGKNLSQALRRLRYPDNARTLWIDAICINQADVTERDAQVKRMNLVYSLASRVVVWLGEEKNDSNHAITTLQYFSDQVEYTTDEFMGSSPGSTEKGWWVHNKPLPYGDREWHSLMTFFNREWFSRIWVIQEVALANRNAICYCGQDSISWPALRKAMIMLQEKQDTPAGIINRLAPGRNGMLPHSQRSFSRLLYTVRRRDCTDPRDRIYGILSLVSQKMRDRIQPQYSLPAAYVHRDAVLAHIEVTGRLDLLRQCRLGQVENRRPSWAPDWALAPTCPQFGHLSGHSRQASGLSSAKWRFEAPNVLVVDGIICDTISHVHAPALGDDTASTFQIMRSWAPQDLVKGQYMNGEPLLKAFLEVLHQGRTKERYPDNFFPSIEDRMKWYLAARQSGAVPEGDTFDIDQAHGTVMFQTKKGYLGLSPADAKVGDQVCVLLGLDRPLVIRPQGSDHQIAAPCFVHGLMDGEALLGPLPHDWKLEFWKKDGYHVPSYVNSSDGFRTAEDPRLGPLSDGWRRLKSAAREQDDPYFISDFESLAGGSEERLRSDPRLRPEVLRQAGVPLQETRFV